MTRSQSRALDGSIQSHFDNITSKYAIAKRLHDVLENEQHEFELMNNLGDITTHVNKYPEDIPDIGIELCVLQIETFPKGWHVSLIDKEAKNIFSDISQDLINLDYSKQKDFIFRLTIWHNNKIPNIKPKVTPGTILHIKRVHHIQVWKGQAQGSIRVDECNHVTKTSKKVEHTDVYNSSINKDDSDEEN